MSKNSFINRVITISKNEKLRKHVSWGIFILSLVFSLLTYLMFSGVSVFPDSPTTVLLLLNIDLLLFVLLAGLVIRKVTKLWLERKRNIGGSGLHIKLAILFMVVAGVPTIMVTVFSAIFFNVAITSWFSEQVHNAVYDSLAVAEDYYKESRQLIANDALVISNEIATEIANVRDEKILEKFFTEQLKRQNIDELVIIDGKGNVNLQIGDMSALKEESLPNWIFEQANKGVIAVNINPKGDRIRALTKLGGDSYLYIGKSINPTIINHINNAKKAIANYQGLEGQRSFLEITFTVIFIVIALILLLVSVWIGMGLATGLIKPITYLVNASEKIAQGKSSIKIPELDSKDELAQLVSSFNKMTSEIATQKNELIAKNMHIDERRRLIETILAGVSSGVVNVTKDMKIRMANIRACELLGDLNLHIGESFYDVSPQLRPIITQLEESLFKNIQENITITIDGKVRRFFVRVISEYSNDTDIAGYVFTFDDMTELEEAQRGAAWSDVARRIAHEIKNPLTPIQLSAERLLKKYKDKIDDEAFLTCVNTIIRQVQDIGKMVDEFSRFAKMPSPQMKKVVLADIISENILLQKEANRSIKYEFDNNNITEKITCDKSQISQVIMNLLKNAAEAIQSKQEDEPVDGLIKINLIKDGKYAIISIEDNGRGIPESDLSRITEPYVTTKAKGTGIGLAIVKKIVEDHKGTLEIKNRKEGGAKVKFSLEL